MYSYQPTTKSRHDAGLDGRVNTQSDSRETRSVLHRAAMTSERSGGEGNGANDSYRYGEE